MEIPAYRRTITHSPNGRDETGTTLQLLPFSAGLRLAGYQGFDEPITLDLAAGYEVWESGDGEPLIYAKDEYRDGFSIAEALDCQIARIVG